MKKIYLALATLMTVLGANAQIVYHSLGDTIVDSSATSPNVFLIPDDHDAGNFDIPISFGGGTSAGVILFAATNSDGTLQNNYATVIPSIAIFKYPKAYDEGYCRGAADTVWTDMAYANDGLSGNEDHITYVHFTNATLDGLIQAPRIGSDSTDKYLFIKFVSRTLTDTALHYGWVHISIEKDSSDITGDGVIFHDWAYNATPGVSICAGEGAGCPTALNIRGQFGDNVYVDSTNQMLAGSIIDSFVTWSVSDSTIATIDANGVITGVSEGTVTVYAARNGDTVCADVFDTTQIVVSINTTGIMEKDFGKLVMFPNPAQNYVDIQANSISNVEVINLLGETVIAKNETETNSIRIDLETLDKGLYLIRVTNNKGSVTRKLLLN